MKKLFLYASILVASMAFTACTEDYTDWADPQAYAQEEASATYGLNIVEGSQSNVVMAEAPEMIELVAVSAESADIAEITLKSVTVHGITIPAVLEDGIVKVRAIELDSIVEVATLDRSATPHTFDVVTNFAAKLTTGEAKEVHGTTSATVTPIATPEIDEKGYAMLGQWQGWNPGNPTWMTKVEDGVYQAEVTTTDAGDNWFKFYKGSGFGEGDFAWDAVALGCATNGDATTPNLVVWENDPIYGGFQTPVISGAGTWVITLDMNKMCYKYEPIEKKYYVVGTPQGWNDSNKSCLFYAHGGNVYSYATNWANQWSLKIWDEDSFGNWSVAFGATVDGSTDASGSLVNDNAGAFGPSTDGGYYILTINMGNKTYEWTPVENLTDYTSISLIGGFNDWGGDVDLTQSESAPHNWYVRHTLDADTELKFRANHDWSVNWGSDKSAEISEDCYYVNPGGDNIIVKAGTYDFYLNDITGRFCIVKI